VFPGVSSTSVAGAQTNLLGFRHYSFPAPPPNFLLKPPMGRPKNQGLTSRGIANWITYASIFGSQLETTKESTPINS